MAGDITTGVDKLVSLIEEKKRISISDAAAELSVPKVVIEEWADFLHQQGVIDLEYKFTTPFLVKRELTKDEVAHKSKDFEGRKEGFVRKVEAAIDFISKESFGLKKVKDEFSKLSKELEEDVKKVRSELSVLENYESLKRNIDREILDQQESFRKQMESVEAQIIDKQKSYEDLVNHIKEEELKLDEEMTKTQLIKKNENILKERLVKIQKATQMMEQELRKEDSDIESIRYNISQMKRFAEKINEGIQSRKKDILPLIEKRKKHEKKIGEIQDDILQKVIKRKEQISSTVVEGKKAKEMFERFFDEKVNIDILMDRINTDLMKLKSELDSLVVEARMWSLTSGKKMSKHIDELEDKFRNAEKKRELFEEQIFKLGKLIRGEK